MAKMPFVVGLHLGNARLSFSDKDGDGVVEVLTGAANEILGEYHYYPFGMRLGYAWMDDAGLDNQYQYNGKELNEDFGLNWYDYGARWYDAAIGRFTGVDPMADQFAWVTPYNYAENEPVANIDLWGLQRIFYGKTLNNESFKKANELRVASNEGIKTNISVYNSERNQTAHDVYFVFHNLQGSEETRNATAATYTFSSKSLDEKGNLITDTRSSSFFRERGLMKENYSESKESGNNFSVIVINTESKAFQEALKDGPEALLRLAEAIHHEMKAHVVPKIENESIEGDIKAEHQAYHGNYTRTSPPIERAKNGTPQKKFLDEARKILEKN